MEKITSWHKTRTGYAIFGVVELAAAYGFASWAIDGGSLLDYLFVILFLVGGVQNIIKLVIKVARRGNK